MSVVVAMCVLLVTARTAVSDSWRSSGLVWKLGLAWILFAERNALMKAEARAQKIVSYGNAPALLVDALQQFPREVWRFKPAPDQWSIHEIVIHVSDSEANCYIRCRKCIAEPGQAVMAYDEHQWAAALRYHDQSTETARPVVQLFL